MSIDQAIKTINGFQGQSLTQSLSEIESGVVGLSLVELKQFCGTRGIDNTFLASALSIKKVASQINVIIHAAGILHSLLTVLEPGEVVQRVSLGAGNTGRKFDLETDRRVAEYKFIDWQGGPESIRQNGIFKDFFELAEHETTKRRYLYVVGTDFPLKFFRGGRALASVLSRQPGILALIAEKYGADVVRVSDYYDLNKDKVHICDISPHIGRDA